MKNKKGFVLVETIIVMSVVMIALIGIYNSYVTVIKKAKQKMYYDNINDVYRLNVISEIITSSTFLNTTCSNYTKCQNIQGTLFPNLKSNESIHIIIYPATVNSNVVDNLSYKNSFNRYLQTTNYNYDKKLIILRYIDSDENEHFASLEV